MHKDRKIAYFSMEIALRNDLPTYSGGLGVLAGDTIKSFADLDFPVVAMTMLYRDGYFIQRLLRNGEQQQEKVSWNPEDILRKLPQQVSIAIEGREVIVGVWEYLQTGVEGTVPVYFLDTDLEENDLQDRQISSQLYGGEKYMRLCQELVLGFAGIKMLRALGYKQFETYHMNEGHAAFLTLQLLAENGWQDDKVRELCMFTTHTPVAAGHDKFEYDLAYRVAGNQLPWHIKEIAGENELNMTKLALNMSRHTNAVSKKHGEVSRDMFPDYQINSITNGVHAGTWVCKQMAGVFDKYISDWHSNPELSFAKADGIPLQEIEDAHLVSKRKLIKYIKQVRGIEFSEDILIIGFARRAATYKRADLLFSDIKRLIQIASGRVQFVFAGKAHPKDKPAQELIRRIFKAAVKLKKDIPIVYLENYDMELGQILTSGVDVWLNNPRRPREASGTSGMKAAMNGVPNFSVLDGWWIEGYKKDITGWSIGPEAKEKNMAGYDDNQDANDLYEKLEKEVIPTFYLDKKKWQKIMLGAIKYNGAYFNTHRMVNEYYQKGYMAHIIQKQEIAS